MSKGIGTICIDTERCKGCGLCTEACPKHLITLSDKEINRYGYFFAEITDDENCTGCASCGIMCPDACITVYKSKYNG